MATKKEETQHIEHIAKETLTQFDKISETVQKALHDEIDLRPDAIANMNTLTSAPVVQTMNRMNMEKRESYRILLHEPAIARVVVASSDGKRNTYYICRTTPISDISNFASYRSPVGRLASLSIGDRFSLPNGSKVDVLERAQLYPYKYDELWDSKNTVVETDHFGPITVDSLRKLLEEIAGEEIGGDILGKLLVEESRRTNIIEGIRKNVITKMGLRDQPVLDKYQDEIFRLEMDKRLLILGPPGTGKTTTLIRRLGQKLDTAFLDDHEKSIVDNVGNLNASSHADSWLMFTPTELLKQYLKEAFAREHVPASDLRIRTWFDYRRVLARNTFGVLSTATGEGSFVLKDSVETLSTDALEKPMVWFSDFFAWQRTAFIDELRKSAQILSENIDQNIADTGQRLFSIIQSTGDSSLATMFISFSSAADGIHTLITSMKELSDKKIRGALNLQLNRNNAFIDELAKFIDGLQQEPDVEDDDPDIQDIDEDEIIARQTGRQKAISAYEKAVRAKARAVASKRSIRKSSLNAKILEWLGDRILEESVLSEIGTSLIVQSNIRRFANPVKRYINNLPKRYKAFRKLRQEEKKWYQKDGYAHTDIHPLEIDIVLLAILKSANELLSNSNIMRNVDLSFWSSLKSVLDLYKNQIFVDEVTDFSPIQIACMAALAHPRIRSFFACGDFNQRLTTWGSRSIDEMKWVFPDIEIKTITVTYRQSRQLNDLARSIILAVGGTEEDVTLPLHVENEGVDPALLEGVSDFNAVIAWLAQRICEIERFVGQLPSIAIFVENESDVQRVADTLNAALIDKNTQVVACRNGQAMGHDNDIRVFDVQHIKGLEFEAVFFVAIDHLAKLHPQLFDKYLYVGTTRAATYLGITCEKELPASISSLRTMFVSDWKTQ